MIINLNGPCSPSKMKTTKDGLQYLINDHKNIRNLFNNYRNATLVEEKQNIANTFIKEIVQHASVEERYVYPLFKKYIPGKRGEMLYERSVTDDNLNKEMMSLIQKLDPKVDCDLFDKTVQKFIMIEENHITEEEEWFNELKTKMPSEEIEKLEDVLREGKKTAPIHPSGPSKPGLLTKMMHPVARMIQKAQQSVSGE